MITEEQIGWYCSVCGKDGSIEPGKAFYDFKDHFICLTCFNSHEQEHIIQILQSMNNGGDF